jgi:hypothetical protein
MLHWYAFADKCNISGAGKLIMFYPCGLFLKQQGSVFCRPGALQGCNKKTVKKISSRFFIKNEFDYRNKIVLSGRPSIEMVASLSQAPSPKLIMA